MVEVLSTDRWGMELYGKILIILCYILRFTRVFKDGSEYDTRDAPLRTDIIVPVELQEAEFRLFLYLQNSAIVTSLLVCDKDGDIPRHSNIVLLKPYLRPRDLLRICGCLHLLDYDPLILPQSRVVAFVCDKDGDIPRHSNIVLLKPYLRPRGLLRICGCLHLLDYDPLILPQSRVVALFSSKEHIRLKHAGLANLITALRSRFWIVVCSDKLIKYVVVALVA